MEQAKCCISAVGRNMKEIWKEFEKDWEISNFGNIKQKGLLKKPYYHTKRYLEITANNKKYLVHRIVATMFIPNPKNLPQVNHIDGNKEKTAYGYIWKFE